SSLPKEILEQLGKLLADTDQYVRRSAADALGKQDISSLTDSDYISKSQTTIITVLVFKSLVEKIPVYPSDEGNIIYFCKKDKIELSSLDKKNEFLKNFQMAFSTLTGIEIVDETNSASSKISMSTHYESHGLLGKKSGQVTEKNRLAIKLAEKILGNV